jgi:outer membrane protein TolC
LQNQLSGVADRRLDNVSQSEQIVASGYRQGLNDALDLYLARNQVERQQANLAAQKQRVLESSATLQLALARYPDGDVASPGTLPVIREGVPAGLPSELLLRRADLQQAWFNLLEADANLAAAHKARFPSRPSHSFNRDDSRPTNGRLESVFAKSSGLTSTRFTGRSPRSKMRYPATCR